MTNKRGTKMFFLGMGIGAMVGFFTAAICAVNGRVGKETPTQPDTAESAEPTGSSEGQICGNEQK